MKRLYPMSVSLESKRCLVVGGGKVALRKVESLLEYGAEVVVVSPRVEEGIRNRAQEKMISLREREFSDCDLDDVVMVFIATDDHALNNHIVRLCKSRHIWVNAADNPDESDFFVPSVLRRGSLSIAVSTDGKSPLLAARLRRELETLITEEYGEFVEILGEVREKIKKTDLTIEKRQQVYRQLVDSDILELLKEGEKEKVEERIARCISSWQD